MALKAGAEPSACLPPYLGTKRPQTSERAPLTLVCP